MNIKFLMITTMMFSMSFVTSSASAMNMLTSVFGGKSTTSNTTAELSIGQVEGQLRSGEVAILFDRAKTPFIIDDNGNSSFNAACPDWRVSPKTIILKKPSEKSLVTLSKVLSVYAEDCLERKKVTVVVDGITKWSEHFIQPLSKLQNVKALTLKNIDGAMICALAPSKTALPAARITAGNKEIENPFWSKGQTVSLTLDSIKSPELYYSSLTGNYKVPFNLDLLLNNNKITSVTVSNSTVCADNYYGIKELKIQNSRICDASVEHLNGIPFEAKYNYYYKKGIEWTGINNTVINQTRGVYIDTVTIPESLEVLEYTPDDKRSLAINLNKLGGWQKPGNMKKVSFGDKLASLYLINEEANLVGNELFGGEYKVKNINFFDSNNLETLTKTKTIENRDTGKNLGFCCLVKAYKDLYNNSVANSCPLGVINDTIQKNSQAEANYFDNKPSSAIEAFNESFSL